MSRRRKSSADSMIERAYLATCSGIQINILDISKVFNAGRAAIAAGQDYAQLCVTVRAFVETIRS